MVTITAMRDLSFDDMQLFTRVAELGTLSAVARERDVPVSQVSRLLTRLEKACGARLIHRSTHGLALTPEGDTFLAYCQRLLATFDELEGDFASRSGQASGLVRVACSTVIAEHLLIPSFEALQQRHPKLCVDLQVEDRLVDMAHDGIDIAIRTGAPLSDTVVARQLGTLDRRLYATPGYLQAHGQPKHPDDLRQHRLISNSAVPTLNRWPFVVKGQTSVVVAEGYLRSGSTGITAQLALQGLGISRVATLVGEPLVRRGLLVPVLADFVARQPSPIYAITLTSRNRLPKIKACIDHWVDWFSHAEGVEKTAAGPG